jgi:hypothetical protein
MEYSILLKIKIFVLGRDALAILGFNAKYIWNNAEKQTEINYICGAAHHTSFVSSSFACREARRIRRITHGAV